MFKLLKILGYIFAFIFFKRLIQSFLTTEQKTHAPKPHDSSAIEAQFRKID